MEGEEGRDISVAGSEQTIAFCWTAKWRRLNARRPQALAHFPRMQLAASGQCRPAQATWPCTVSATGVWRLGKGQSIDYDQSRSQFLGVCNRLTVCILAKHGLDISGPQHLIATLT